MMCVLLPDCIPSTLPISTYVYSGTYTVRLVVPYIYTDSKYQVEFGTIAALECRIVRVWGICSGSYQIAAQENMHPATPTFHQSTRIIRTSETSYALERDNVTTNHSNPFLSCQTPLMVLTLSSSCLTADPSSSPFLHSGSTATVTEAPSSSDLFACFLNLPAYFTNPIRLSNPVTGRPFAWIFLYPPRRPSRVNASKSHT